MLRLPLTRIMLGVADLTNLETRKQANDEHTYAGHYVTPSLDVTKLYLAGQSATENRSLAATRTESLSSPCSSPQYSNDYSSQHDEADELGIESTRVTKDDQFVHSSYHRGLDVGSSTVSEDSFYFEGFVEQETDPVGINDGPHVEGMLKFDHTWRFQFL